MLRIFQRITRLRHRLSLSAAVHWLSLSVAFLVTVGVVVLAVSTPPGPDYSGPQLIIGSGSPGGVYYPLGGALANAWTQRGMSATALATNGSVDNIDRLRADGVNVAIATQDAADDAYNNGFRGLRALGRLYDDYIHVVVRANSPLHTLADLKGRHDTVSLGAPASGSALTAKRLLIAAGLDPAKEVTDTTLGLEPATEALADGQIEAFFWSGGLPTPAIVDLAKKLPIRILDLSDVVPTLQRLYPDYAAYRTGTIPQSTYVTSNVTPPTTLVLPDLLLVTATMPNDVAEALVNELFAAKSQIDNATHHVGLQIDVLHAIYTSPIPLHDGALNYYRSNKM